MTPPPALRLTGQHRIDARPLFDVDMTLAAGAWTCLLGPSGVGKSTVLRLLLGLETGGAFDGTITASDGQPLAGRISYMAQSDLLLPWLTVIENIMIGDRLRGTTPDRDRASAMLARVGLQDHAHKKPAALSGGMRQRAALARTLLFLLGRTLGSSLAGLGVTHVLPCAIERERVTTLEPEAELRRRALLSFPTRRA